MEISIFQVGRMYEFIREGNKKTRLKVKERIQEENRITIVFNRKGGEYRAYTDSKFVVSYSLFHPNIEECRVSPDETISSRDLVNLNFCNNCDSLLSKGDRIFFSLSEHTLCFLCAGYILSSYLNKGYDKERIEKCVEGHIWEIKKEENKFVTSGTYCYLDEEGFRQKMRVELMSEDRISIYYLEKYVEINLSMYASWQNISLTPTMKLYSYYKCGSTHGVMEPVYVFSDNKISRMYL